MTASRRALLLSVGTLLSYVAFAYFRHRQLADDDYRGANADISSGLLLAFFLLWAFATLIVYRPTRVRYKEPMTNSNSHMCRVSVGWLQPTADATSCFPRYPRRKFDGPLWSPTAVLMLCLLFPG